MKYIVSFLLLGLLVAPVMGQRPYRGDHKKQDQRVEKFVGKKSCSKCVALEKEVAGLRKRLEGATKGRDKTDHRKRGRADRHRGNRRGDQHWGRKGSRADNGRRQWNRKKVAPTRKKGREQLQKKYRGRRTVS